VRIRGMSERGDRQSIVGSNRRANVKGRARSNKRMQRRPRIEFHIVLSIPLAAPLMRVVRCYIEFEIL
jgi:hypothetical protein